MDLQTCKSIVEDLRDNIEVKNIPKDYHLDYDTMEIIGPDNDKVILADASVRSQILTLWNPGIHLNSVLAKLKGSGMVRKTDPITKDVLVPDTIAEDLLRYCELNRDRGVRALTHKKSHLAYGVVSPNHQITQDADVLEIYENVFQDIPHEVSFEHNYFRMRINIDLKEIAIELGDNNAMDFRMSLGNSMFGVGSAFIRAGSYELVCSNGAMGWRTKLNKTYEIEPNVFDWRKRHTYAPSVILKDMSHSMVKQLTHADKYMQALENANEVNESIFKKNEKVEEALTKQQIGLTQNEALEAYKLMKHKHQQYGRTNGFDVGRAIAEVARDTTNLDRRIELETIASKVMFSQI